MVMSSTDIAMMMSQQNQMFMGQQQFAQQIGLPMGGGYQQGGGFNYAPSGGMMGPGFSGGNRFAGGAMSAMGAAASVGGMGLGVAGMFGKLGPLGALTDPIAGGMAGFARMGLAGAIGGAALPLGIGMAASHAIGSVVQGGQQQQMIGNQLGQFQFFNPAARGGTGFTRQDTMAIGDQIRSMAHIPEMMTSVQELTKLLPKLKSSGMMQGVRDATEFAQRFKESIKTIRDVSKTLGTTMEEAADFFAHSRGVGFLGRQAQMQNVLNAQFTSGVTGMNMGQVMGLQQAGAGVAQQFGASRRLGATAVTNIAQQLGVAQQQGRIKEGQLEDVTGLQGPEAIQALSTRFAGAMAGMAQSTAPGRLSIAGMVKFDESGKAVGIDEEIAKRYREGNIGVDELRRRASNLTNAQKISFTRRIADISMDYAGKAGVGGMATLMQAAVGGRFGEGSSEAAGLLLQRHGGMTTGETDIMQAMGGMGDTTGMKDAMARIRQREAQIREKTSPEAVLRKIKARIHSSTSAHLEQAGAKIFNEMGRAYDEFIDDLVGRHVVTLSKEGADNFARAMGGGGTGELKRMFEAAQKGRQAMGAGGLGASGRWMKRGIGLAAGLGVGALTGGNIPLAAMAATGAMSAADSMLQGESEMGAFIRRGAGDTGRTAQGELEHFQGLMGSGRQDQIAKVVDKSKGFRFQGQDEAARTMDRLRLNVEGYRDMDNARKLDEMRGQVNRTMQMGLMESAKGYEIQALLRGDESALKRLGGEAGLEKELQRMSGSERGAEAASMVRASRAGQKKFGIGDAASAAVAASQSGMGSSNALKIKFGDIASAGGAARFKDVKAAATAMREASKKLDDVLGPEVAAAIRDKPGVKSAVRRAQGNKEIRDAINEGDTTKLAELGIDVKAEDLGSIQSALDTVDKVGTEALGAINDFEVARKGNDFVALKQNLEDTAADLVVGARGLEGESASLVRDLGKSIKSATETGDFDTMQTKVLAVTRKAASLKGKDRDKFLGALGALGGAIGGELGRKTGLQVGTKYTKEELGGKLGLEGKDLDAILAGTDVSAGGKLQEGTLKEITTRAAALRGGAAIGGKAGDSRTGGDTDKETLKLLQDMQTTQKNLVTITQAVAKEMGAEVPSDKLEGSKEGANASKGGGTSFSAPREMGPKF